MSFPADSVGFMRLCFCCFSLWFSSWRFLLLRLLSLFVTREPHWDIKCDSGLTTKWLTADFQQSHKWDESLWKVSERKERWKWRQNRRNKQSGEQPVQLLHNTEMCRASCLLKCTWHLNSFARRLFLHPAYWCIMEHGNICKRCQAVWMREIGGEEERLCFCV